MTAATASRPWRALLLVLCSALLAACAPFHRSIGAAERAKLPEVDVRVVVAQESFMFSAQPPGAAAALGGGMIGALIDSSVQQARQKEMSAEVGATVGPLLDYDYRTEAGIALGEIGATGLYPPLRIASAQVLPAMPPKAQHEARIAATRNGPAYLVLLLQYALEPGLGAFTTRTTALLWQDGGSEPVYRAGAIYQSPIGGGTRPTVVRRLVANDGQALRAVMRDSVMQTMRLFALDIAGARAGPVKTGRFNVNGTWVVIGGQGIEDTQAGPPRVLFRDEDKALYSIRSTVP
ncbi:hypothetical protein [Variovorax sp.]|jgi:hypothetical protein|uniref:hypothetical protein n=1 Tax=Variovorax sp. TaxID=1871043 RepID=UPI0037D9CA78